MPSIRAFAVALLLGAAASGPLQAQTVEMKTNLGTIVIELNAEKAPKTVENFVQYVKDGYYKGTIFHRVIPGFMAQGGGYTPEFRQKPARDPIQNEANNGLQNAVGTIAMARTSNPHSATAQFFINVADNGFLNHTGQTSRGWGYCVFGKVVKGMDVVNAMIAIPTGPSGPFPSDVPQKAIVIEDVRIAAGQ